MNELPTASFASAASRAAVATAVYSLTSGVGLVDRGKQGVQIGTDPPLSALLTGAPAGAAEFLSSLDGATPLADLIRRHSADPALWTDLVGRLLAAGLAARVDAADTADPVAERDPTFHPERSALAHRHGPGAVERLLRIRRDSLVTVVGSGRVAGWTATLLAGSGIGHVHHRPDRPVRSSDLVPGPGDGRGIADDEGLLGSRLAHDHPGVHVRAPAGQVVPALTVLAGDGPADPGVAAALRAAGVPHLSVWAGPSRAVVGPLVLPGRSSCLHCADLYRRDADPQWPRVDRVRRANRIPPPIATAAAVAAIAVQEVLDQLEGVVRPSTVDGTWDWAGAAAGTAGRPRRRSWSVHRGCPCATPAADRAARG